MSTFGQVFRVTTYGESHCRSVGCIVDGCPPGMALAESDVQPQLSRRRPGQSNLTTPRDEKDQVEIQSGVEYGVTLGTPIGMLVRNQDHRPHDYTETDLYPRPSHADWTYIEKYGLKASSGGGRASARETIGRVAAGAIAEKYLRQVYGVEIVAFVSSVGSVRMPFIDAEDRGVQSPVMRDFYQLLDRVSRADVDADTVRCPDAASCDRMREEILAVKADNDSIGGTVTCVIRGLPTGLGEPCFDKLEAKLAHAMLSIPATKGFEIGSGFRGTEMRGHLHNDAWVIAPGDANGHSGRLSTATNHSGGIQGGISNGQHVYFRLAFKPPATISRNQETCTYDGVPGVLATRGRHDPCVVPRAVPIVEAMAALVVMDAVLIQQARQNAARLLPTIPLQPCMTGKAPTEPNGKE
ncbi:chorismate synthase [Thamnocephalis sphaerospora]|uniref:Chorismate synthase n=1 Tax=Thamnocephalis sphaerospora TaxID=78915 RepID=A0A4V1IW48_9FUNG|nr:chorismate synthase [Thamnocephalis sphaerospora]|eukprot:RKP06309.1 chorismate synthase [Thamnocephalis sphaerospora]